MDSNLDELKKQATIDNSALEEIMKKRITLENQWKFFDILKESQLFMPVSYSANMFEGIEDAEVGEVFEPEDQVGFDIIYLTDEEDNKAVPLFTSSEIMQSTELNSSAIALFMSDLAEMLKKTDRYSAIAINPFTESNINMPIEVFLSLFAEFSDEEKEFLEGLNHLLRALKEHSVELAENTTLFIRADENFMVENAVDGVFVPDVPFYASSNPKYGEEFKYTNILLMPESKRILPIGPDEELDVIIAPGTEFKLEDTLDKTQNLWMCGAQPFYDDV